MPNKFLGSGGPGYHPVRKLKIVLAGLRFAVLHDFSVLYKLLLSLIVLFFSLIFNQWIDAAVILIVTGLVLGAELFNTAIEALCDFVEVRHNDKIGIIKDIAAAATGICILVWVIVLALEIYEFWPKLLA